MRALIYLETRVLVNSLRNLSRSPKRMVPGLIFFAWVLASVANVFQFGRYGASHNNAQFDLLQSLPVERIETGMFILIASVCAIVVYNAFDSGIMTFSVSDIDFLFATPLERRDVLMFRLIKDYWKYTLWVLMIILLMLPLISSSFGALGMSIMPDGLIGLSAILALIYLVTNVAHLVNIVFNFGFQRLQTAGVVVKTVLVAIPVLAIAYTLYQFMQTRDIWVSLLWVIDSPLIKYLFAPARWTAQLLLAPLIGTTQDGWLELSMLWILAGGTFLILLAREENIYEPALKTSLRNARRKIAASSGDQTELRADRLRETGKTKRGWITLPKSAKPLEAVFWKNVLVRYRASTLRVVFSFVVPILVVIYFWQAVSDKMLLKYLPVFVAYMGCVLPFSVQPELRSDLRYAAVIKSTPVSSFGIMFAQMLSSLLYSIPALLAMGFAFWLFIPASRGDLLVACTVAGSFLLFPNTAVFIVAGLLYPNNKDVAQNYLCVIVGMLLSGLIMLPVIIVAVFSKWYIGLTILQSAAVACLTSLIFGAAAITLAGQLFKSYEPSSE